MALLFTRLYAPLTGLATARVELMSALVSFERIFEVLDLKPMIQEPEQPQPIPAGGIRIEFNNVDFQYPAAADEIGRASCRERGRAGEVAGAPHEEETSAATATG